MPQIVGIQKLSTALLETFIENFFRTASLKKKHYNYKILYHLSVFKRYVPFSTEKLIVKM